MAVVIVRDDDIAGLTFDERMAYLERRLYAAGFDFRFPIQIVRTQQDPTAELFLQ